MIGSASVGDMSSARAIATFSDQPPHSSTRVNSQMRPSETAKVERSWPTETATTAPRSAPGSGSCGSETRTEQRKRLEVDPDDLQARLLARVDVAVDELAVGDDEEHAADGLSFIVDRLGEHLVVEHRVLDRNRQHFLRAEPDRVRKLLRVVDADDVEGPDADPVVRDPEPDPALRQVVLLEEVPQRNGERLGVAKLAADDDAVIERLAHGLHELGRAPVVNACRGDLRAADLEADDLLRAAAGNARPWTSEGFGRGRRRSFDFGFGLESAGSAASHCLAERLNEKSRL